MKRIILALTLIALTLTACGQGRNKKTNEDMKTLVAYFSATGTTAAVARDLADVTGGKLYEIKPEVRYTAEDLDWTVKTSRSSVEMQDRSSRPAIVKDLENADSYDVIYIGFPVWWYTAPRIINTFLESYDFSGKTVIPFATSGGSEMGDIPDKIKTSCSEKANFKPGKRFSGYDIDTLKKWIDSINI